MVQIRPVSDLRNKFSEIEAAASEGNPIFLTKNGYSSMVLLSLEAYSRLTDDVEDALDEADNQVATNPKRLTKDELFNAVRRRVNG